MNQNMTLVQQADELVLAGRYREAQASCERVLAVQPDHLPALCILGNACLLQQDYATAYEQFMIAAALEPEVFDAHVGLGLAAQNLGRPDEALMHFRRAQEIDPDNVELLRLVGSLLQETGRTSEAQQSFLRAGTLQRPAIGSRTRQKPPHAPPLPAWQTELKQAMALIGRNRYQEAVPLLQHVIGRKPDLAEAYIQLSYALYQLGQVAAAEEWCRKGLAVMPQTAQLHNNLGMLLMEQNRPEEAIDSYIQANTLDPKLVAVFSNLGIALSRMGRLEEAEVISRAGLELDPDRPALQHNLGLIMLAQNREAEAIDLLERALTGHPDNAEIALDLGMLHLKHGDFVRGWPRYELRASNQQRKFRQPRWQGEDLQDKTILVWAEYGFGDTLQFVRYLPMLKAGGARVILEHQPALGSLLQSAAGCDLLTPARLDGQAPAIDFDVQIGLMSLPYLFQTRLDTIPAAVPYLSAAPDKVETWRQRLETDGAGFRVGIVWAGNRAYPNDAFRSCRLADFAPLAQVSGTRLYSLQKGEPADQASAPPEGMEIIDLAPELDDFTDTAAIIMNLDLVISVDTAVAHLAGALGRSVWTLLIYHGEWRWLTDREDTPWYPTMQLFRQPTLGDWSSVMAAVCRKLQAESSR